MSLCAVPLYHIYVFPRYPRGRLRGVLFSDAQHINLISHQDAENGDPKVLKWDWPRNSGKVRVL